MQRTDDLIPCLKLWVEHILCRLETDHQILKTNNPLEASWSTNKKLQTTFCAMKLNIKQLSLEHSTFCLETSASTIYRWVYWKPKLLLSVTQTFRRLQISLFHLFLYKYLATLSETSYLKIDKASKELNNWINNIKPYYQYN